MLLPVQPHRPHTARASLALLSIVSSLALSSIGCPKPCSPEEDTTNSVAPSEVTETTDLSGTTGVQTRSDMQAPSETFQFPDEVNINQMFISFPNMKFNIQDADACSKIGEIESVFWSAAIQFKMRDASGKQIARGRQKIISWGVEFEIFDEADQKIATVEERVWESIFKTTTAYDIKAPDGTLLGTSHKFDFSRRVSISRTPTA